MPSARTRLQRARFKCVKCMKIVILLTVLALIAYLLWPRSNYSEVGRIIDLPKYFNLLQNSSPSFETLIISIKASDDFVQFSRDGKNVEMDFPLVTPQQKALELKFRAVCKKQNLDIREVIGSDESLFLDADLPKATRDRANIVKNILTDVFDITESEKLKFTFY